MSDCLHVHGRQPFPCETLSCAYLFIEVAIGGFEHLFGRLAAIIGTRGVCKVSIFPFGQTCLVRRDRPHNGCVAHAELFTTCVVS